jgi:bifunctional enzyme Fae/Hps
MLNRKTNYLQIALNNTMDDAYNIVRQLPQSNRILLEAGTPLIKRYGIDVISQIKSWWQSKNFFSSLPAYVVADLKTMDRGETEVALASQAGASAVVGLGQSPIETINAFIESCKKYQLDSMLDLMNVEQPIKIIRKLKKLPDVVLLHRGVDEETFNKDKPIPYLQINKIRATSNVLISIAGGDTIREVQRAIFNGANIVVVWKEFFRSTSETGNLAQEFLKVIK